MIHRLCLAIALMISSTLFLSTGAAAQDATPSEETEVVVLAPDESYAGLTRAEWDVQQWQMMMSFPADINPGFDVTGERCGYGQHGPVFLLPGSFSPEPRDITCVVPYGVAIFVPLGSAICSTVEPEPYFGSNEEELAACATASNDVLLDIGVSINGNEVLDAMSYRTVSQMSSVVFPENNVWEVQPGVAGVVSDSYSIIIAPPAPGEYVIETSMMIDGVPEPFVGTFNIVVQEPQIIPPSEEPEASPVS